MNKIIISKDDFEEINRLLLDMLYSDPNNNDLKEFSDDLNSAQIFTSERIMPDIITLYSCVELIDTNNQETMIKKIVLPPADFEAQELSVLSPIGMSIIGRKRGDVVDCKVPAGVRRIKIQNIFDETHSLNFSGGY